MFGLGKSLFVTLALVVIVWFVARLADVHFSLGWSLLLTVLFTLLLDAAALLYTDRRGVLRS